MTDTLWMLVSNLTGICLFMVVLWRVSVAISDVSFIDAVWPFGMVLLALATWLRIAEPGLGQTLILGLTALWGLRLASHLWVRWRAHGVDPRYAKILGAAKEKRGWSFSRASLQLVFGMQGPLLFLVCLPAQLGIVLSNGSVGIIGWAGAAIALTGIAFESIGDAQLVRFRTNPANQGKVLDTGLWRYTRHPNYFGDACTWWGIWLMALDASPWAALGSIIGPVFLNFTLVKWSGAALLERGLKKSRPGYAEYIARTSSFIPWPPKG